MAIKEKGFFDTPLKKCKMENFKTESINGI